MHTPYHIPYNTRYKLPVLSRMQIITGRGIRWCIYVLFASHAAGLEAHSAGWHYTCYWIITRVVRSDARVSVDVFEAVMVTYTSRIVGNTKSMSAREKKKTDIQIVRCRLMSIRRLFAVLFPDLCSFRDTNHLKMLHTIAAPTICLEREVQLTMWNEQRAEVAIRQFGENRKMPRWQPRMLSNEVVAMRNFLRSSLRIFNALVG